MRVLLIAAAFAASAFAATTPENVSQPLIYGANRERLIPNSYLVKLKDNTLESTASLHQEWLGQMYSLRESQKKELRRRRLEHQHVLNDKSEYGGVTQIYNFDDDFRGYAIHADEYIVEEIRKHPDVSSFILQV